MSEVASHVTLGKVVHIEDRYGPFELVINRGARDGIMPGQRFLVFGYGPEIEDPVSGENLGRIELVRGRGAVIHVQDDCATLRSIERRPECTGQRVTRDTLVLGYAMGRGKVIGEDWPAEEEVPFRNAALGDLARPI